MRAYRRTLSPVAALLCLVGCDAGGETTFETLVSDSAGVRMVLNRGISFDRGAPEWRVSSQPHVVIGRPDGGREYLFDRIMGIARISGGSWAVADMGSSEVRYYDPAGLHISSAGRPGEGPGEFRQIMALYPLAGDSLLVDDAYARIHLLEGNGIFVGTHTLPGSPSQERTQIIGTFSDGSLVARTTSAYTQMIDTPNTLWAEYHTADLRNLADDVLDLAPIDPIARFETVRLVPGWRGSATTIRFDGYTHSAIMSNGVVGADPMTFEVRVFGSDGGLRTVFRVADWMFSPITESDRTQDRTEYINQRGEDGGVVPPQLLQQRRDIADLFVYAPHMPAFSDMQVDDNDGIWLREYVPNEATVGSFVRVPAEASRWLVFDHNGIPTGRISLPPRFGPLVFGADFVAGVYRDEMDVEYVHSYYLERPRP